MENLNPTELKLLMGLVALSAALVSSLISWAIHSRTVRAQLERLKLEVSNAYAGKLQEHRLDAYPEIFGALYLFAHKVQRREADFEDLREMSELMHRWYLEKGALLGVHARGVWYSYKRKTLRILDKGPEPFSSRLGDPEQRRSLIRDNWKVNLALQADLGIFDAEFFERGAKFNSYDEIWRGLEND